MFLFWLQITTIDVNVHKTPPLVSKQKQALRNDKDTEVPPYVIVEYIYKCIMTILNSL